MEINNGRTLAVDKKNTLNKLTNNPDCYQQSDVDKCIHNEFLATIKRNLKSKTKTTVIERNGDDKTKNFKKWYKMAYPEKYQSSKSQLGKGNISPNLMFSPDSSIISKNMNLNETFDVLKNKDMLKPDSNFINKQYFANSLKPFNQSINNYAEKTIKLDKINIHEETKGDKIFSNTFKNNFTNFLTKERVNRSQAEIGLRNYYNKNKKKFLNKLLKGPSECFRWISWIVSLEVPENRTDDQYFSLLSQNGDLIIENQISKDLHRTLTDDNLFSSESSRKQLFNILKAFAVNDKKVAYCQGMNCVAGFILVVSDYNEIDSFYLLLSLFGSREYNSLGVRGFYLPEFPLLQLYLYQFDYIFYKKMPFLKKHFENLGIPNEAWVSKWFQTLYTICLPLNVVKRLWDCIFAIGLEFLFSFTLAILQHFEEDLIKFNDMIDLSEYLKSMNPYLNKKQNKQKLDVEKIISDAIKIVIPKNVLDNLKAEYEKIYNVDLTKINMRYSINEFTENKENINDSISFGDCSYIDLASTIKRKESTICINEEINSDVIDISVSSEFDTIKKEVKISDKVNNHILKLSDIKKAPVIVRKSSKSLCKNVNILAKIKNENNFINANTNSTNNHSNTTKMKSLYEGGY